MAPRDPRPCLGHRTGTPATGVPASARRGARGAVEEDVGFTPRHQRRPRPGIRERGKGRQVVPPGGDDVARASPGVRDVPRGAGNHMDVERVDGLARGLAHVHADVVTVGAELALDVLPDPGDGAEDLPLLPGGGVEPARHVARGDDEGVARGASNGGGTELAHRPVGRVPG